MFPVLVAVMLTKDPLNHCTQQASGFVSVKVKFTYTQLLLVLELFARVGATVVMPVGAMVSMLMKKDPFMPMLPAVSFAKME